MAKDKVWMRMGDSDDYREFDDPFSAGYELGSYLSETGTEKFKASDVRWLDLGLEVDGFESTNYVSLFWGDSDAQDAQELTGADKTDFVAGVKDGGYFVQKPKTVKTVKKSKSRRESATGAMTTLRRIR